MRYQSPPLYYRVEGMYALFTDPATKGGGEKFTYSTPTQQALIGITDSIYYKPTIRNIVDEVRINNEIQTDTKGVRNLVKAGKGADLNYVTYLSEVSYDVKFHFEWNENRKDLVRDRNPGKHFSIAKRSIDRGGRRDIFLGSRECLGYVTPLTEEEYESAASYYDNSKMSLGIMFQCFEYPVETNQPLMAHFSNLQIVDGIIRFKSIENTDFSRELKNYHFKTNGEIKPVEEEFSEYEEMQ